MSSKSDIEKPETSERLGIQSIACSPCGECEMPVEPNEYHPYGGCLMFKACHDSATVRANLWAIQERSYNNGQPQVGSDALVRCIAGMTGEAIQAAIDASHPVEQIADLGNLETQRCLDADALAMNLISGRHGKRQIVNMIRWLLMGAPNDQAQPTPVTTIESKQNEH